MVASEMTAPTLKTSLPSLSRLMADLNRQGVRYCHWKSNIRMEEALQGGTDLDILIHPDDLVTFWDTLDHYGVRALRPAPGRDYPGITHQLGYDETTGKLYHLHVHTQLVIGEQLTKNYHLPLEDGLLSGERTLLGVRIPPPEAELIIFSLRALLKYRDRDGVKALLKLDPTGFPTRVIKEYRWLRSRVDPSSLETMLNGWSVYIPVAAVRGFIQEMDDPSGDTLRILKLRNEVRRGLHTYQRKSRWASMLAYFREDWRRRRKIFKPKRVPKMTVGIPGMRIAIVGADGSGKSTVVRSLADWLSWRLDVRTYYLGKTRTSFGVRAVGPIVNVFRGLHGLSSRYLGAQNPLTRVFKAGRQLLESWRMVGEARDKHRRYRKSLQDAAQGAIILYDRFPVEDFRLTTNTLDGPRIASRVNPEHNRVLSLLANQETRIYREIHPADHTILLRVSPEVSQARKPDHDRTMLANKATLLNSDTQPSNGVVTISADQSLEDVLRQAKSIIWSWL